MNVSVNSSVLMFNGKNNFLLIKSEPTIQETNLHYQVHFGIICYNLFLILHHLPLVRKDAFKKSTIPIRVIVTGLKT